MSEILKRLREKTPKKAVVFWLLSTIGYALIVLINENQHLIDDLTYLSDNAKSHIKMIGIFSYMVITKLSFLQTKKEENDNNTTSD